MINLKEIKSYPVKKSKSFGYTFSTIFALFSIYLYLSSDYISFKLLSATIILFFVTFTFPNSLKVFSYYWDKFGIVLGRFFSPIILVAVYFITIIPINLIFRVLSVDLIKKKKQKSLQTYWVEKKQTECEFRDQF